MSETAPKAAGLPLKLEHITKSFDGVPVLRDVSYEGEVRALAIIGPRVAASPHCCASWEDCLPPTAAGSQ